MSTPSLESLEQRLTALEKEVAELRHLKRSGPTFKDWRQAIGLFPGDDFMKQIDEAGRAIREADRQEASS